jgi:hypothetical protein
MCIFAQTNVNDMKKIMYVIAAAVVLLATGCKKEKFDPAMPSVAWESNPKFETAELTQSLDAVVTVSAPGKFQDLKLSLGLGNYNILANPYISISSNKGGSTNPILDLMGDPSCVSFAKGLGMTVGQPLKDRSEVKLDLKAMLEKILLGQVVDNNTTFSIDVRVTDQNGKMVSKTAKIHFTAAPVISWAKNETFAPVDVFAPEMECKVDIWAPGKIEQLTVTLGEASAPFLKDYVNKRITPPSGATTGGPVIDLVADPLVQDSFKDWFPAGEGVSGKEKVTLNFGFMYGMKYDLQVSTNTFTIVVVDKNGKQTIQQLVFKRVE